MHRWLLTLLVPSLALAAAPDVTVETSRQIYVVGDTVEIVVTNKRAAPIFLPGCGAFQLERFANDRYLPVSADPCPAEGEAVQVEPGASFTLTWSTQGARAGDILRVGLAHGWGCSAGRALSQARCEDFATAWSTSFRIGKRSEVQ